MRIFIRFKLHLSSEYKAFSYFLLERVKPLVFSSAVMRKSSQIVFLKYCMSKMSEAKFTGLEDDRDNFGSIAKNGSRNCQN